MEGFSGAMEEPQKLATIQREVADTGVVAGKTSKRGIILRPQPTNDPNEPLVSRPFFLACWTAPHSIL